MFDRLLSPRYEKSQAAIHHGASMHDGGVLQAVIPIGFGLDTFSEVAYSELGTHDHDDHV